MIVARFILELLILAASGLGSGLFLLRNRKCAPIEKLCLAIGVSWLVVYLAATGIYLAHLPASCNFAISGGSLLLLILSWRELKNLGRSRQILQTVCGFLLLLFWNLLMLSLIRHFSGGLWSGDWYEHYQRSIFFLDDQPKNTLFVGGYLLPARPPMMNILCAHVLAQIGGGYDLYQPITVFLNLLIYFPCVLLTSALARRGRRQLAVLVILFAVSPLLAANVTGSITKLFCGFYVLLGAWLYLRGYQKQDSPRLVAGFASLCAGVLVHYSAGPYLLFFALHYACVWWGRRRKLLEPLLTAAVCVPLLASWFGWSIWFYGWKTTVSSNTTVTDSQKLSTTGNLGKIGLNILFTFLPHPFHVSRHDFDANFFQPNAMGYVRDYWFLIYQHTLPLGIGIFGGFVVLYLLIRNLLLGKKSDGSLGAAQGPAVPASVRIFWIGFIVVCTLAGIAVHGTLLEYGTAPICLLPLSLLGVTFLAANFAALPVWLRRTVAAFAVVDFCLGVFLHIRMERLYFQPRILGPTQLLPLDDQLLCGQAVINSLYRAHLHLTLWGDHLRFLAGPLQGLMICILALLLHPLALATRGSALPLRRRPDGFFYMLLFILAAGSLYCIQDEFNGAIASALRLRQASPDELKEDVAAASSAVAAAPDSSFAHLRLGECIYRAGDSAAASEHLAYAYALDTSNLQARYDLILMYSMANQFQPDTLNLFFAAERVFRAPQSASARAQLADLLLRYRHIEQSSNSLRTR